MLTKTSNPKRIMVFIGLIMLASMLASIFLGRVSLLTVLNGSRTTSALPYTTISYNGREYESADELHRLVTAYDADCAVELSLDLPARPEYDSFALAICTYYCQIEVRCGDELRYSYGDRHEQKIVGSGYHFIPLPRDYADKETTILLYPTDPSSLLDTESFVFGEWDAIHLNNVRTNSVTFCIDVFMLVLGVVLAGVSLVGLIYSPLFRIMLSVGMLSMNVGFWMLCNSKLIQFFITDLDLLLQLEYQSFYLIVFSLLLYIYIIVRKDKILRRGCTIAAVISLVVVACIEVLQILDIRDYNETLTWYHVLGGLDIGFSIYAAVRRLKNEKEMGAGLYFLMAVIGLTLFVGMEYVAFYYNRTTQLSQSPIVSIPFGMMFFVVTILISGIGYMFSAVRRSNERYLLRRMAYTDVLTGIGNRARCEQTAAELEAAGEDFSFVLMDLNNLKKANDTLGHKAGDKLLCDFASIIAESFGDAAAVCRIGGDEFGVILPYAGSERLRGAVDKFVRANTNADGSMRVPASHGFATSGEIDGRSWEDVYKLADSRMYEMKTRQHKNATSAAQVNTPQEANTPHEANTP